MIDPLRAAAQAVVDEWTQTIEDGGLVTIALADPVAALRAALAAAEARPGLEEVLSVLSNVPHDDQHPCTACRRDGALAAARQIEARP